MIQSREVLPDSIEHALLANRIVSLLTQIEKNEDPVDRDRTLKDAIQFLQVIREGREFTQNLRLSERSYQAALAYGEAIKAIERLSAANSPATEGIEGFIADLIRVAEDIRDRKDVKEQALAWFDGFFRFVREVAMSAGGARMERVNFGD